MRFNHRRHPREHGQSLTEFALVLPILLLIFMGIMDFGRLLFLYSQVVNAAREGARYGSVTGVGAHNAQNPRFIDCEAIRAAATSVFGLDMGLAPEDIIIEYDQVAAGQAHPVVYGQCVDENNHPEIRDIRTGDRIRVTVHAHFKLLTPVIRNLMPSVDVRFTSARTVIAGGTLVPPGDQ